MVEPIEHEFRSRVARIAKLVIDVLPADLDPTVQAEELLCVATKERSTYGSKSSSHAPNPSDMQAKLYCLVYHICGIAQQFEVGDLGQEFQKWPMLGVRLKRLQGA
jgi:hypothetical protein